MPRGVGITGNASSVEQFGWLSLKSLAFVLTWQKRLRVQPRRGVPALGNRRRLFSSYLQGNSTTQVNRALVHVT